MKKILGIILLFLFIFNISSAPIDKRVASVKLNKAQIITLKQVDRRFEDMKALNIPVKSKEEVLENMIDEELLKQAAEQSKVRVNDEQVLSALQAQLGGKASSMTKKQIEDVFVRQTGKDFNVYFEENRNKMKMQIFLERKKASLGNKKEPTLEEITKIYEDNPQMFVRSESVKLSQIYIETIGLGEKEKAKAIKLAKKIQKDAKSSNFALLVENYSSDTKSRFKDGDIGYLQKGNVKLQKVLGKEFFDTAFSLKVGQVSKVVESKGGLHILLATEFFERELLSLEDKITPESDETVKQRIIKMKAFENEQIKTKEIIDNLRKEAEVETFKENLK